MNLQLWNSSQELVVESSHPESSDISRLSQSNGIATAAKSLESESQTDGFPACRCGKGTFDCSNHPSGVEEYLALQAAAFNILWKMMEESA